MWAAGFPFFNLYKLVVLLRGRRLVEEARAGASMASSPAARLVAAAFRALFALNLRRTPWGWQLLAVAVHDVRPKSERPSALDSATVPGGADDAA